VTADTIQAALADITAETDPTLKPSMSNPKLSDSGVPMIPMNEVMSYEDWLAGRKQRRLTGMRIAPEIIRRPSSSSDRRLRRLYNGERGLRFTPTDKL